MTSKEVHDAGREALREVSDPHRPAPDEDERLLRYLGGAAYHEERVEERVEERGEDEEDRRGERRPAGQPGD